MFFGSDNSSPAHPNVLNALVNANNGYTSGYGNEEAMFNITKKIRTLFEAPNASVYLVATGTAANSLALATITKPWETIFCHKNSHIEEDECGAPEFYTNGAKLTLIDGPNAKMCPYKLNEAIKYYYQKEVHNIQNGSLSITNVTEFGTIYSLDEMQKLTEIAKINGLKTHLDGARFANAMVALDCSPAELTWKSGIDVVSFGGTKNGCMGVEAVIFFNQELAWEFELRRKRGGHLFSKHRFLSAQMEGYLDGDLWIDLAKKANNSCQKLLKKLQDVTGIEIIHPPQGNLIFATITKSMHDKLIARGAKYNFWEPQIKSSKTSSSDIKIRLACSWSTSDLEIDKLVKSFN